MLEQKFEQEQSPKSFELPSIDLLSKEYDFDKGNQKVVFTRSIFESEEWQNCNAEIPLALGKNQNGNSVILDLAKAPHILMSGMTGSGKSVCIHTMITSLLFRFRPDELKFLLFDPQIVEFDVYENLPHLLTPVINDSDKFLFALRWANDEIVRRYQVMRTAEVKHIREFNDQSHADENHVYMPIIVIIIGELFDLMLSDARRDAEELIARIAQRGRTAGIHLIISTQRPSAKIITNIIKSNMVTRICFKIISQCDSRMVLEHGGAEKLRGMGDMICRTPGRMDMERIQGAWMGIDDIQRVVRFISEQATPEFNSFVISGPNEEYVCAFSGEEAWNMSEYAPLIKKHLRPDDPPLARAALALMLAEGRICISWLQRHLKIGYNEASSLIDLFAERGIIRLSPEGGPKYELLISVECDTKGKQKNE